MGKDRPLGRLFAWWGPVATQMGLIYFFSAQPAGSEVLQRFPLPPGLGHLGGYALLGLLLYRALARGLRRWEPRAAAAALGLALLYGVTDEVHQIFVPGRDASPVDLCIDGAGAALSLAAFRAWLYLQRKGLRRGGAPAGEREQKP